MTKNPSAVQTNLFQWRCLLLPEDEVEDGDDRAELLGVAGVGAGEVGGQHDDVQHHAQDVDEKGE